MTKESIGAVDDLLVWARKYMLEQPDPDFIVLQNGEPYLQRWYIVPRNDLMNVYLHRFLRSDDDRGLHNHRGDNRSILLEGQYLEHLDDGSVHLRSAGDVIRREAADFHRVELVGGAPIVSLFFIGPTVRDWGFKCPDGRYVPWQEYVEVVPGGNTSGKGCG